MGPPRVPMMLAHPNMMRGMPPMGMPNYMMGGYPMGP